VNTRLLIVLGIAVTVSSLSQANAQTTMPDGTNGPAPTFVVHTTTRTVQAVNYQHRGGATKINFAGTPMMPSATGIAVVKSLRGSMAIDAEFGDLEKPTAFGTEYLTYILWAISPEGRAINLGEVLVGGNHRSRLRVSTDLQAFALIVTAEPYYAVRQPSDVVVLENVVRSDTKGTSEAVNAKYELMGRGGYIPTGYKFDPVVLDAKLPLEFMEARNALRIAESEGAERFANESYQHAVQLMNTADAYATEKHSSKRELIATSRETVQTAEDARAIAARNLDEAIRAGELQNSASALAHSQAETDEATRQKNQAQSDTARAHSDNDLAQAASVQAQSENAVAQVQRRKAESDNAMAQSDNATAQAERVKAQAEAAASRANMVAAQADATASQTGMVNAQANSTKAQADADKAQADMAANQASSAAQVNAANAAANQSRAAEELAQQNEHRAESEKAVLRAQLESRLNQILQTRDSARGLVVSMSDVLFDTGKFSLNPGAREKLAKVAGILMSYPTLIIEVGGYTDNVGSDDMNQTLSQNRAGSVRDYLVKQGVEGKSVSARGFGNTSPVASNDNSGGRQSNRRVELVVSGEAIGVPAPPTTVSLR
jgi:outer membrane protein OmpA-like peptidoglycan-associated protein